MAVNQPEQAKHAQRPQRARGGAGEDERTDTLRAMLLDRRNALTREIGALVARMSAEQGGQREQSIADAVDLSLQYATGDQQVLMLELRHDTRNEINEALRRLDEGAYGVCEDCGARINIERLRAVPFARRCVECPRNADEAERIEQEPEGM
jgi:DnaK suppressor protein